MEALELAKILITADETFILTAVGLCGVHTVGRCLRLKKFSLSPAPQILNLALAVGAIWTSILLLGIVSGVRPPEDIRSGKILILAVSLWWIYEQLHRIVAAFGIEAEEKPPPPPT